MSENPVNSKESDSKGGAVENWDRIVHKNVRTSDNQGFGKVVAIPDNSDTVVVTSQSGSDRYMLPKSAVSGFNGAEVMLGITLAEMRAYRMEEPKVREGQPSDLEIEQEVVTEPQQETIPLIEERLNVKKYTKTEQATIRKEPIKETKTLEVPITYDELIIERRPASGTESPSPSEKAEELRISLSREEFEVKKEPYVKEELVIKKEPKTETKTVTETVVSERLASSDIPIKGSNP